MMKIAIGLPQARIVHICPELAAEDSMGID
jgi:hypothetical protein